MALTNKIKNVWKYLNTSHGTHSGIVYEGGPNYDSIVPVRVDILNRTPLKKIILTSIVVGVIGGSVLGIRSCIKEQTIKRERNEAYSRQADKYFSIISLEKEVDLVEDHGIYKSDPWRPKIDFQDYLMKKEKLNKMTGEYEKEYGFNPIIKPEHVRERKSLSNN